MRQRCASTHPPSNDRGTSFIQSAWKLETACIFDTVTHWMHVYTKTVVTVSAKQARAEAMIPECGELKSFQVLSLGLDHSRPSAI
jgi:acetone carboxylase gamma subunit